LLFTSASADRKVITTILMDQPAEVSESRPKRTKKLSLKAQENAEIFKIYGTYKPPNPKLDTRKRSNIDVIEGEETEQAKKPKKATRKRKTSTSTSESKNDSEPVAIEKKESVISDAKDEKVNTTSTEETKTEKKPRKPRTKKQKLDEPKVDISVAPIPTPTTPQKVTAIPVSDTGLLSVAAMHPLTMTFPPVAITTAISTPRFPPVAILDLTEEALVKGKDDLPKKEKSKKPRTPKKEAEKRLKKNEVFLMLFQKE